MYRSIRACADVQSFAYAVVEVEVLLPPRLQVVCAEAGVEGTSRTDEASAAAESAHLRFRDMISLRCEGDCEASKNETLP